jgi:hypothetical protein
MYIPDKFKYEAIKRVDTPEGRRYATPDGNKLPSVTTVLSATTPQEKKQALQEWRTRMGHKRAQEFLEDYIKTGELSASGSNPYSIQSHKMADSIIRQGLQNCSEFWGTEVPLYFPSVYAGTTDLVGVHDGSESIMDHKQTNKPKKREWIDDYFIQLAAYATAHNELHGTKIRKGVIFMCDPNAVYQEFILEGDEFDKFQNEWYKRLELFYSQFV